MMWGSRTLAILVLVAPAGAGAQPPAPEDLWRIDAPRCRLALDGGLAVGFPAALPTGLTRGLGLGVQGIARGERLAWGVRASLTTATESSAAWEVEHRELRLRATGSLQHAAGRGTLALRLGLGGALVREHRTRHQGMRAGLEGDELETSALALLPIASLEGVIALGVRGPWSLRIAGGPTVILDGGPRAGWTGEIGVAWRR